MSLITQYTFIIRWLHRKASLLIKKTFPFLKKLFFHKKTITTIRPSLLPTKKGSLERLPFLWKGFYWHNLLIILFLSVIFRTILYPIGASGQGYCCTALGRDECVGIKASGSSDILVTKLRRYRCYVYPIRQHFSCDDMTQRIHRHCPPAFLQARLHVSLYFDLLTANPLLS